MSSGPDRCYRHSGRETRLRCGNCERSICASCAHQTPVSTKCPECISAGTPPLLKVGAADRLAIFVFPLGAAIGTGVIGAYLVHFLILATLNAWFVTLLFLAYQMLVGLGAGFLLRTVKARKLSVNRIYIAGAAPVVSYAVTNLYNILTPLFNTPAIFSVASVWLITAGVIASALIALRMVR